MSCPTSAPIPPLTAGEIAYEKWTTRTYEWSNRGTLIESRGQLQALIAAALAEKDRRIAELEREREIQNRIHDNQHDELVRRRQEIEQAKARATSAEALSAAMVERERVLRDALSDMHSGWRYIRVRYGDLEGIGWDRCEEKAMSALSSPAPGNGEADHG